LRGVPPPQQQPPTPTLLLNKTQVLPFSGEQVKPAPTATGAPPTAPEPALESVAPLAESPVEQPAPVAAAPVAAAKPKPWPPWASSARLVAILVAIPVVGAVTAGNVYLFGENQRAAGQRVVQVDEEAAKEREARVYQRALNQFAAGDLERAAGGFRLLATASNDIDVRARAKLRLSYCYRRLGNRALIAGDTASAERWYQAAVHVAPGDQWVRRTLKTVRRMQQQRQSGDTATVSAATTP
jgi:tetratricopeptide (TPR) repeat protein